MNIELLTTARIKFTGLTVHIVSFYVSSKYCIRYYNVTVSNIVFIYTGDSEILKKFPKIHPVRIVVASQCSVVLL